MSDQTLREQLAGLRERVEDRAIQRIADRGGLWACVLCGVKVDGPGSVPQHFVACPVRTLATLAAYPAGVEPDLADIIHEEDKKAVDAAKDEDAPQPVQADGERTSDLVTILWTAMHGRCAACSWPLAADKEHGCVPGDCSFRPGEHDPQHHIWLRRAKLMREINLAAAQPAKPGSERE